jgi:hypothetical protein
VAARPKALSSDENRAALFGAHFDAIAQLAAERFQLPAEAAEQVAYDVLLASLPHVDNVSDLRAWLVGATAAAASRAAGRRDAQ